MEGSSGPVFSESSYALTLADESCDWYRTAAIRSRRSHRASVMTIQVMAAAIPIAAIISPKSSLVPAILGALIVILTGLRSTFHWQENYFRFSKARETVEAERRFYRFGAPPYDNAATKDQALAMKITKIEKDEMDVWIKIPEHQAKK